MDTKKKEAGIQQIRKAIAYDEAIGKLHEAGVGDDFIKALDTSPELLKAVKKIGPDIGPVADWSCCITVSNPVKPGTAVSNPNPESVKKKVQK